MTTECGARALSDFVLSRYKERAVLQSYTERALSECCSMLAGLVRELDLKPLILTSTGRSQDWKRLFQLCQPAFERALQILIFSHEALPKTINHSIELQMEPEDSLLDDWFIIVYSPELVYLVLAPATPNTDSNNISVLVCFDHELIETSADWLIARVAAADRLSAFTAQFETGRQRACQLGDRHREKCMASAMEKMIYNLNRTAMEHDRIEHEMESTLYKLALSNSELAVLNTMVEKISRSLDLREIYQSVLKAVEVVDLEAAIILLLDEQKRLLIDFFGGTTSEMAEALKALTERFIISGGQPSDELKICYTDEIEAELEQYSAIVRQAGVRTIVCMPLRSRNSIIGLIVLPSTSRRNFSIEDRRLLANISSQVGIAIESANLYSKILTANEQLQKAIKLKDELVSMVAHDFRSPLTSIQAFSELLQDRVEDEEMKRFLSIINRQSKHLASLAADTLTMSRLESGNLPFKFKPFKITELIASLVEARAAESSIDLKLDMPMEEIEIVGDYSRIYEVLDNLIGNAIKYSPDGVSVRLTLVKTDEGVQISIADKGLGILSSDLPKLFQKFSRLDNARQRQISGTGLGLYICRSIIEAHDGKIWAESEEGKGSTFYFTLPFQVKSRDDRQP
jgi:signal transduction histidine kinase